MVAFTGLSQELLCVIYFLIFHSRGDIRRLQRILGEVALSTPHSGAIFSFVLHEMECLISVSLTHAVLCLCGFVRHILSHSRKVKGIFLLKEKRRWRVQHRQTSSNIIESLFSLFLGIICYNSPQMLYSSMPSPLSDKGGFCLSEGTLTNNPFTIRPSSVWSLFYLQHANVHMYANEEDGNRNGRHSHLSSREREGPSLAGGHWNSLRYY